MNRDVLAKNGVVALTPPRLGKRISPTIRNAMGLLSTKRNRPIKSFFRIRKARKIFSGLVAESCPITPRIKSLFRMRVYLVPLSCLLDLAFTLQHTKVLLQSGKCCGVLPPSFI